MSLAPLFHLWDYNFIVAITLLAALYLVLLQWARSILAVNDKSGRHVAFDFLQEAKINLMRRNSFGNHK